MQVRSGIHPVLEALRAGAPMDRVLVARGLGGPRIQEVIDACRKAGIPVRFESREALDRMAQGSVHQGVVAIGAARKSHSLSDLIGRSLLVVLDSVEDPHNLGAIARSAHAAGAGGLVVPERRAAGITDTVTKAAAGALEHIPLARVKNLNTAIRTLKDSGYWIYGLDERGETCYWDTAWQHPAAIVLGSEGAGLHRLTRESCDFLLRIPMAGAVASLNVSVAAGVVLFEWRRRQNEAKT
jgi:23S rRNA (guanosine2251-2'-O)-methyltransferase